MSTDKALPLLLLADKYNVQPLRNVCVDYMMKHIEESPDKNKTLTWQVCFITLNVGICVKVKYV